MTVSQHDVITQFKRLQEAGKRLRESQEKLVEAAKKYSLRMNLPAPLGVGDAMRIVERIKKGELQ